MGVNQFQAAEILNLTGGEVEITVGRDPQPGEDQVFQIIQQTNSTAEEVNASVSTAHPEQKPEEDNVSQFTLDGVKKLSENPSIYDVNDLLEDEDDDDAEESVKVSDAKETQSPSNEPKETDKTEDDLKDCLDLANFQD